MEKAVDKISWIRELVKAEQQMEESGMVDMSAGFDPEKQLQMDTIQFLTRLKNDFVESVNAFNELKASAIGRIKIYGIAKTHADFMLFRNGFKMIFSMKTPGTISIRFNFIGTGMVSTPVNPSLPGNVSANLMDEHVVLAKVGPFGDITWTYQNQPIQLAAVVRHHLTLFIQESAK